MYQDMNPPHSLHQLFKRILTTTGSQAAASPGKRKVPADLSAGPFRRRQRSSERLSVHPPAEASSRCSTVGGACQEELSTSSELGTLTTLLWRCRHFLHRLGALQYMHLPFYQLLRRSKRVRHFLAPKVPILAQGIRPGSTTLEATQKGPLRKL